MSSEKTVVIKYLWDFLQEEGLGRRVVHREDVVNAIQHCASASGIELSEGNAANFMKDVVRGDHANDFWPPELTALRITAQQRPSRGSRRVFEFVNFEEAQTEPFPNPYKPTPEMAPIPVEAVSLSLAKRSLGRKDESWLVQVAVELRLVQTHFATHSLESVVEVNHLQTGVKLGTSEIDSLFLAHLQSTDNTLIRALVTCEAKQEGQRILDHQIVEQVVAASKSVRAAGMDVTKIIPIAVKAYEGGQVYLAEFKSWEHSDADKSEEERPKLQLASHAVYALRPPVPGIGHKNVKPKRVRVGAKSKAATMPGS